MIVGGRLQKFQKSMRKIFLGIQIRRRIVPIPPGIVFSYAFPCLLDLIQRILDRTRLWSAVMFLKIGLELLLGFVGVHQKLPPRAER